jgi:hypothetical protein
MTTLIMPNAVQINGELVDSYHMDAFYWHPYFQHYVIERGGYLQILDF